MTRKKVIIRKKKIIFVLSTVGRVGGNNGKLKIGKHEVGALLIDSTYIIRYVEFGSFL